MVNDNLQKAPFVTNNMGPCSPPENGHVVSIMISFDKKTWSNPILNPLAHNNAFNSNIIVIIVGCVLIFVILIIIIYFANKRRHNFKYPVYREARQIVQFPQNESQEVVYASNKQVY